MDVAAFLDRLRSARGYEGQLTHVELLAARGARCTAPTPPLPEALCRMLAAQGIEALYTHQAAALDTARAGRDLVVVSGTASGKTLCYHLPILEAILADSEACGLFLYPTKALAQDQLRGLLALLGGEPQVAEAALPGVFDGDTPPAQRRRIQAEANLVLTNPDMLHVSLLPQHPKWARFFAELRYVVIDEAHMYRGILGANVACVLRRLARVCEHYGSRPVFLAASATIANPGELVSRLIGREAAVIDDDGAPRGRKFFALWNPAPLGADRLARRSAQDDATDLILAALAEDAQTLAFTRTRQTAELVRRYVEERLTDQSSPLAGRVRAYRGGYLPEERRALERGLAEGELRAVAATNALELGLDIGSLDVALLVGYPGTIASVWQQAGRAGRRQDDSLAVLIAGNDPVDQFLLRNPDYFFAQSPERAVVDAENPYVLTSHLRAAAFELPLSADDAGRFGPLTEPIAGMLCDAEELNRVGESYYFAGGQNPAQEVRLRHMSDNTFSIVEQRMAALGGERPPSGRRRADPLRPEHEVLANVDAISAPELVYPEAVYLHDGETYLVRELDLQAKIAYVERRETDYYTQAVLETTIQTVSSRQSSAALGTAEAHFGDVLVSWRTVAFKKIKFGTRENIGLGPVDIPAQTLPSTGLWLVPSDPVRRAMREAGCRTSEGLAGLKNLAIVALPFLAMCDSRDLGGAIDSKHAGHSTLVLYDRYPGGLGYTEQGFHRLAELLELCRRIVAECPCEEGCPSCVGLPNLRPAIHSDPDLTRGYPMPDKRATLRLAEALLETAAAESLHASP